MEDPNERRRSIRLTIEKATRGADAPWLLPIGRPPMEHDLLRAWTDHAAAQVDVLTRGSLGDVYPIIVDPRRLSDRAVAAAVTWLIVRGLHGDPPTPEHASRLLADFLRNVAQLRADREERGEEEPPDDRPDGDWGGRFVLIGLLAAGRQAGR